MAWPNDFVTGDLLTSQKLNEWPDALRAAFPYPEHYRARLTPQNTTFGGSGSPATVSFASAAENVGGMWSASQPTRVTAIVSAPHLVLARIGNTSDSGNGVQLHLMWNGSAVIAMAVDFSPAVMLTIVNMSAGDYLELAVEVFVGNDSVAPSYSEFYVEVL